MKLLRNIVVGMVITSIFVIGVCALNAKYPPQQSIQPTLPPQVITVHVETDTKLLDRIEQLVREKKEADDVIADQARQLAAYSKIVGGGK